MESGADPQSLSKQSRLEQHPSSTTPQAMRQLLSKQINWQQMMCWEESQTQLSQGLR